MQGASHLQFSEADIDSVEERGDVSAEQQGKQPPGYPGERRPLERLMLRCVDPLVSASNS
jgi:hypothetical protein